MSVQSTQYYRGDKSVFLSASLQLSSCIKFSFKQQSLVSLLFYISIWEKGKNTYSNCIITNPVMVQVLILPFQVTSASN